ncbi:lecithin retinol acyltransferase family protein [Comamonas sp.]|uniref:lecithin retinol acyltransferase family protein n=1 Tax=Comamonas sp. TaxID=34028 RepID=UPI0028989108|nr:lecithin retinol acyltransferase family protein [Comamonas sp.]
MKKGDHLVSPRTGYTHHGLYIGERKVIHYGGLADGFTKEGICITSLRKFEAGKGSWVEEHAVCIFNSHQRVERAMSKVGEDDYNVLFNNCEHFVNWCFDGFSSSSQLGGSNLSDHFETATIAATAVIFPVTNPVIATGFVLKKLWEHINR